MSALTAVDVEHVGSTSVPALVAKPVLDLQAAPPVLDDAVAALLDDGWSLRVVEPGHRLLRPPVGGPAANLHLHLPDDPALAARRRFRDRLRADPSARDRYAALKRSLAGRDWADTNDYADAKGPLVRELLQ